MAKLYATIGSLAAIIVANIFFKIFNLFPVNHYIVLDIITTALVVLGIVSLLRDFNIFNDLESKPIKLAIIALIIGYLFELLSFGAVFYTDKFLLVSKTWWVIAPVIIGLIGIPILLITKQVSREKIIWRMKANGWRGWIFSALFSGAYTFTALYIINLVFPMLFEM